MVTINACHDSPDIQEVRICMAIMLQTQEWTSHNGLPEIGGVDHPHRGDVIPSGKDTKSYWKWPTEIVDLPIKMVIVNSYVSLPEGISISPRTWLGNSTFFAGTKNNLLKRPERCVHEEIRVQCKRKCQNSFPLVTGFSYRNFRFLDLRW